MSTNRSNDRFSLCSFMFVDGHSCACPVAPAFRGGPLFARIQRAARLPQAGEQPACALPFELVSAVLRFGEPRE
jgi:hypothetical protein